VEEGLDVKTNSEKVIAERKLSIQKLMARAPKSEVIKELAKKYGVDSTPLPLGRPSELRTLLAVYPRVRGSGRR